MPELGDTFDILSAAGGLGDTTFATVLQPVGVPAGRFFSAIYSPTTVQLLVISNLPGDYNNDGVVDAGDYVMWRKFEGLSVALLNDPIGGTIDQDQYDQWSAHFGETAPGSGSMANTAVPEPATLILLTLAAVVWCLRRGRTAENSTNNSTASGIHRKSTGFDPAEVGLKECLTNGSHDGAR